MVSAGLIGCGGSPEPPTAGEGSSSATALIGESDGQHSSNGRGARVAAVEQIPPAEDLRLRIPSSSPPVAEPATGFRASDDRRAHNIDRLKQLGINRFESKRCVLFTDIDPGVAKNLPMFVDALYETLVDYFGELPINREGTEFQVTGYLMKDQKIFLKAGLLPKNLPSFEHGRHSGYEFWMNDQQWDYYRRHLMLHEATHCFMTCCMQNENIAPPAWYMEGMAEWFATHRVVDGQIDIAVMQQTDSGYDGFSRVRLVRDAVDAGETIPFQRFVALGPGDYVETRHYAQGWAVCQILNRHPVYQKQFRKLKHLRTYDEFNKGMAIAFANDSGQMQSEVDLFLREIEIGYDFVRNAIRFDTPNQPLQSESLQSERSVTVDAGAGWQSAFLVKKGDTCILTAIGSVVVATQPKPWTSEPDGITVRYCDGYPIGQLQAIVLDEATSRFGSVISVGESTTFTSKTSGTLFLRVNDSAAERADNSGKYSVTLAVKAAQPGEPGDE